MLFLGTAWPDVLWPFQIGFLSSLAAGIGALLALDREDRRGDVIAAVLLGVALASSSLGLPLLAALALEVLGRPDRRSRWWIVALPPRSMRLVPRLRRRGDGDLGQPVRLARLRRRRGRGRRGRAVLARHGLGPPARGGGRGRAAGEPAPARDGVVAAARADRRAARVLGSDRARPRPARRARRAALPLPRRRLPAADRGRGLHRRAAGARRARRRRAHHRVRRARQHRHDARGRRLLARREHRAEWRPRRAAARGRSRSRPTSSPTLGRRRRFAPAPYLDATRDLGSGAPRRRRCRASTSAPALAPTSRCAARSIRSWCPPPPRAALRPTSRLKGRVGRAARRLPRAHRERWRRNRRLVVPRGGLVLRSRTSAVRINLRRFSDAFGGQPIDTSAGGPGVALRLPADSSPVPWRARLTFAGSLRLCG